MHYVLSDIHGDRDAFNTILSMINLQRSDELYIMGDVIDREQYGIELLQQIRSIDNCTLFLGNHELMMINALRYPEHVRYMRIWQNNGCDPTYQAFMALRADEQEELLGYLESLPVQTELKIAEQIFILVHAAPMELYETENIKHDTPREFAVWHRRFSWRVEQQLGQKILIYGHTPTKHKMYSVWPTMRIDKRTRLVDIDCGCAYPEMGGQLACLRLEDMTEFYSREGIVTAEEAQEWLHKMQADYFGEE